LNAPNSVSAGALPQTLLRSLVLSDPIAVSYKEDISVRSLILRWSGERCEWKGIEENVPLPTFE